MNKIRAVKAPPDLPEIPEGADLEKVIEAINDLISSHNFLGKKMSLSANFDGYIAENVTLPAATEVVVQHFLGITPKWRIILKQVGNGVITDVPTKWNDRYITLYNNGAVSVTATIFIVKE